MCHYACASFMYLFYRQHNHHPLYSWSYCMDWNVWSKDAPGHKVVQLIFQNVIKSIATLAPLPPLCCLYSGITQNSCGISDIYVSMYVRTLFLIAMEQFSTLYKAINTYILYSGLCPRQWDSYSCLLLHDLRPAFFFFFHYSFFLFFHMVIIVFYFSFFKLIVKRIMTSAKIPLMMYLYTGIEQFYH